MRYVLAVAAAALLTLTSLSLASTPAAPLLSAPAASVVTVDVPPVSGRSPGGKLYDDILSRDPQPYTTSDRATNAHESCHGVNARIRNAAGGRVNGFYLGNGRGAVVPEPRLRLREVAVFVPASLRGPNFQLYLVQQAASWDDRPLYVCDEWTAYLMGGAVIVQDYRDGRPSSGYLHHGPVEFSLYALALSAATARHDADTWPKVRPFVAHQLEFAGRLYAASRGVPGFSGGQDGLLAAYRTSADAAPLREFAGREFGAAAQWLATATVAKAPDT